MLGQCSGHEQNERNVNHPHALWASLSFAIGLRTYGRTYGRVLR